MVIWWLVTISSTKCISPSIYFYSAKLLCQASEKLMVMNGKPLFVYCQLSMTYRIIEPIFSLFLSWINGPTSIIHKNNQWKPWLLPYHRAELPLIKNGIWGHDNLSTGFVFSSPEALNNVVTNLNLVEQPRYSIYLILRFFKWKGLQGCSLFKRALSSQERSLIVWLSTSMFSLQRAQLVLSHHWIDAFLWCNLKHASLL